MSMIRVKVKPDFVWYGWDVRKETPLWIASRLGLGGSLELLIEKGSEQHEALTANDLVVEVVDDDVSPLDTAEFRQRHPQ